MPKYARPITQSISVCFAEPEKKQEFTGVRKYNFPMFALFIFFFVIVLVLASKKEYKIEGVRCGGAVS